MWLAVSTAALASACGPTVYDIRGTREMPGVDGEIRVGDTGTNRMIEIELKHLPPPGRMASGARYYAVWFRGPDRRAQLAGHLEYDEDDRTGSLRATTPLRRLRVVVTAESRPHPHGPSTEVVLRQRVR